MTKRRVYFHEDDFCQIELVPAENWEYCAREMGNVSAFSAEHRAPEGIGWTDVYLRNAEPVGLIQSALTVEMVAGLLAPHLESFDLVETGYGSHAEECKHTYAYGFDAGSVIYFSEQVGIVNHIWLGLDGPPSDRQAALIQAMATLNQRVPLILVDWGSESLLRLADQDSLKTYLLGREERMRALGEELEKRRAAEAAQRPWWKFSG